MCLGCEATARPSCKATALLTLASKYHAQHAARSRSNPLIIEKGHRLPVR
jgi:hypothetical protein